MVLSIRDSLFHSRSDILGDDNVEAEEGGGEKERQKEVTEKENDSKRL